MPGKSSSIELPHSPGLILDVHPVGLDRRIVLWNSDVVLRLTLSCMRACC